MTRIQIGIALTLIAILIARFFFYFQNQVPYRDGENIELETTLFSEPTISRFNQRIYLQTQRGRVKIILPKYPEYHYGDFARISGVVRFENITQNGKVLIKEKTIPVVYFPKIEPGENKGNWGLAIASFFRQKMIALFQNSLSSPSSGLLLGIVFGIKEPMDKEFTDSVRVSGVMHVIAASGMNVTMVIAFLSPVFLFFFRRQVALLLVGVCIVFYAFVSGLAASIIRASIMGVFVLIAQITGRQTLPVYGLCVAGFLMLFISPQTLFDIGFQLSFVSTLGLLFVRPYIELPSKSVFKNILVGDDIATTISAQIATLPILFFNFGSYSPVSIVVNGLVLWTVPILMVIGGIGGLAGLVFEPLGKVLLYFSLPFLIYFEIVISWFGRHFSSISFENFPWEMGAGYYLILISIVLYFQKTRNTRKISRSVRQLADQKVQKNQNNYKSDNLIL